MTFPHCDSRILHAPGECEYCDMHPDWQRLRQAWDINFTGRVGAALPCPADAARGDGHMNWNGNLPMRDGALSMPDADIVIDAMQGLLFVMEDTNA